MAKVKEEQGDLSKMELLEQEFNKLFGKNSLTNGIDIDTSYDVVPSYSIGLDKALGIGGLPKGRLVELLGWESSGKTTIMLTFIANEHKKNKNSLCAFVDMEHSIDLLYAEKLGCDLKRLKVCKPMNGEEAFDMLYKLIASDLFEIVGLDSIASSTPGKISEEDMSNQTMGLHARLVNKGIERIVPIAEKTNTLVLLSNQYREKIGVMFGPTEVAKGGNAPKFYCSIRLDVSRSTTVANSIIEKGSTDKMGNLTTVKTIKNKCSPPFRSCKFYIRYNEGIDYIKECIDLAIDLKVIIKSKNTWSFNEDNLCVGEENLRPLFLDNPELYEKIKSAVLEKYSPKEFEPVLIDIIE